MRRLDFKNTRIFLLLAMGVGLSACIDPPSDVEVVQGFELQRYLGSWYEIARLDHRFERDMQQVTANYSLRDDGGVRVLNRGFDVAKGNWREAEGRAYFTGDPSVGQLKVSFFGPFYGGYNIMALDIENYQWALVAGPSSSYLWILSRTPQLEKAVTERLVAQAADAGFLVEELIWVDQAD